MFVSAEATTYQMQSSVKLTSWCMAKLIKMLR